MQTTNITVNRADPSLLPEWQEAQPPSFHSFKRSRGFHSGCFAALLLVGVVSSPARAAITYNFDDGTLQGWTTVSSDPGNLNSDPQNYASVTARDGISPQSGTRFVMCQPSVNRDSAHQTLWIRSPEFALDEAGSITLYLAGGTSLGGWPGASGTLPTNASQIPLGVDSTLSGLMGVALRETSTGNFVFTAERPGPSDASWKQISWDVSALLNNGKTYSIELFDYHSGNGWSHLSMDTVSIPGTGALVPEPSSALLLGVLMTGGFLSRRRIP